MSAVEPPVLIAVSRHEITNRPARIAVYEKAGVAFTVQELLWYGPLFKPLTNTSTGYWAATADCHPCDWNTWMAIITNSDCTKMVQEIRDALVHNPDTNTVCVWAWLRAFDTLLMMQGLASSFKTSLQYTGRRDLAWFDNHDRRNQHATEAIVYWIHDLHHLLLFAPK